MVDGLAVETFPLLRHLNSSLPFADNIPSTVNHRPAPLQTREPEGVFATPSGPDEMFRSEAIRLSSGVRHRNHHGRHHHRSRGAWPR